MEQSGSAVRVTSVLPGSGAERGGVRAGDQVVSVGGHAVASPDEVVTAIGGARVGDRVSVELDREGRRQTVSVELGPRPGPGGAIRALVGRQAPPVHLAALAGTDTVDLGSHRGEVAVVYFWSVHCGACRMAAPTLDRWQRTLGSRGLQIIGVTDDEPDAVRSALAGSPVAYTVALDTAAKVGSAYWVEALPTFFVIDRSGVVAHVAEGWDPSQSGTMQAVIERLLQQRAP